MGEIISLKDKFQKTDDNVISWKPWQFRKADWGSFHFIQMLNSQSAELERHRQEVRKKGGSTVCSLPPHFSLKGGMAYTIHAIYACRENEQRMREIYYLTGLMDCMINQVNPILRTDLLRDMYKKVFTMKEKLKIHWYGPLNQVLLPLDFQFYSEQEYSALLNRAATLKELYEAIRQGTDEMFDILSLEYAFYCPSSGG